jgi:hypothetical protein
MPDSKQTDHPTAEALGRLTGQLIYGVLVLYLVVWVVFKDTWDLLVPSLFPGAVELGLVARSISWWTAFLLSGAGTLLLLWSRWITSSWLGSASDRSALVETKVNAIATHLGIDLDAAIKAEVAALSKAGKKVQAIALYRSYSGADLASAKDYVDGCSGSAEPSATPSAKPGATPAT